MSGRGDVKPSAEPVGTIDDGLASVAKAFSGRLSFAAKNLTTGEQILCHPDDVLPTASAIKIAILVEVLRQVDAQSLTLSETLQISDNDVVGGSGILKVLSRGVALPIRDLATMMIALSDNVATNMLLDRIGGVDAVNAAMGDLGLMTIRLHSRIDFDVIGTDIRRFAEASPARDLRDLMEHIERGRVLGPELSALVIEMMTQQLYLDQVPRYLDYNPYGREFGTAERLRVACKTGFYPGTRTDVGAVFIDHGPTLVYCMMSDCGSDGSLWPENEGSAAAGVLGRLMLEHWWPPDLGRPPILESPYAPRLLGHPQPPDVRP